MGLKFKKKMDTGDFFEEWNETTPQIPIRKGPINLALGPPSGFFQTASNQKGGVISMLENIFCVFW